ncbi:hypothetical protein PCASD_18468, partial [Puccinia coronata f. sp. avenae]
MPIQLAHCGKDSNSPRAREPTSTYPQTVPGLRRVQAIRCRLRNGFQSDRHPLGQAAEN